MIGVIPNIMYYGGKSNFLNLDTHQDWQLDTAFSGVFCNSTTLVCTFTACVDRKFRTNDSQDWQLVNAYMQTFGSVGYYTSYNTNSVNTALETRGTN